MRLDVYVKGVSHTTHKKGVGAAGGWAAIGVVNDEIVFRRSGSRTYSNSYKMELLAAAQGSKVAEYMRSRTGSEVTECHIYSDSGTLIKCYEQEWWRKWVRFDWVRYDDTPVKYEEIWRELLPYFVNRLFGFHLNREASKYSEMVEELAYRASTKMKNEDNNGY